MSASSPDVREVESVDPASVELAESDADQASEGSATVRSATVGSGSGELAEPGTDDGEAAASVTVEAESVEAVTVEALADPDVALELASVVAERDAYLEDLQRVTAEFTNFRRQTVKRNTELVAQAASRLARELLVVLDACEAAVSQGVEGIDALQSQLLGVLSAEGLTVLGTADEPFDPGFHEAVMSEESTDDGQDAPVVSEVLRTGYAWNGRVLRPAMVKVRG